MPGKIYLLNDSKLIGMQESEYDSESLLQELLAKHPDLLAGDQVDSDEPRRWVLVKREMSVPDEEDGTGRWAVDHLFLDQDGIPTLVEVKRSTDTRIRREVIGQMLDYAANAVAYWPIEDIRAKFESQCEASGLEPEDELTQLLGEGEEIGDFWQSVKTNLQAGKVRMLFVADVIPSELRRVVEFLNEQMDPAQVLALEVKQFRGEGLTTLVPRVIGQTEVARQKKRAEYIPPASISSEEFVRLFQAERPSEEHDVPLAFLEWIERQNLLADFGHGKKAATLFVIFEHAGKKYYPATLKSSGLARLQMRWLKEYPPFDRAEKRDELHQKLKGFDGLQTTELGMEGLPAVPTATLAEKDKLREFLEVIKWIIQEMTSA